MKNKILASVLLALAPSVAMAAADVSYFDGLVKGIGGVFNSLIPVIIAIAVVYFLWGVLQFIGAGDDEEARKAGRSRMLNGILALFVMVALWGIIAFLAQVLGISLSGGSVTPAPIHIP